MKCQFIYFSTDLQLSEEELKNLTLIEIENLLQANRRSLHEFKGTPHPDSYVTKHIGNRLIHDERDYYVDMNDKISIIYFVQLQIINFTITIILSPTYVRERHV